MDNLNIIIEDTYLVQKLFERSDIAFCSNEVIRILLKRNGFNGNFRVIGLELAKYAIPKRKRTSRGVLRGWMVKYVGVA